MKLFSKTKRQNGKEINNPSLTNGADCIAVKKANKKLNKQKDVAVTIFALTIFIYPILQWLLVYLYCNIDSVLQAFQWYDKVDGGTFHFFDAGEIFTNFKRVFASIFSGGEGENVGLYLRTGAIFYIIQLLILTPVNQFCSFVVVKKMPFHKTMKLLLFTPSILSDMIVIQLLRNFMGFGLPDWLAPLGINMPGSMFEEPRYYGAMIWFLIMFLGFGTGIIINTATMGRVPTELVEAGKIDGLKYAGEYWHIYLPVIYPVMAMTMLGMFSGMLTYAGPLFTTWGYGDDFPERYKTFGYFLFSQQAKVATYNGELPPETLKYTYGYNAAFNLLLGAVSVPIVYATRWLFDKMDPNRDKVKVAL